MTNLATLQSGASCEPLGSKEKINDKEKARKEIEVMMVS